MLVPSCFHGLIKDVKRESAKVARKLLAADADVNAKDNRGRSAQMIATEERAVHVEKLLKAAGAR